MTEIHRIANASVLRAVLAFVFPLGTVLFFVTAYVRAGYGPEDYFTLIAMGKLSLFRQLIAWPAFLLIILIYWPPAYVALTSQPYIYTDGGDLVLPGNRRFRISEIKRLTIRKTFAHKKLTVEQGAGEEAIVVTFAQADVPDLRQDLRDEARLSGILIQ